MSVDKNLFLYDLAVVAIMKNEAPYVKEWLDYHLLAGVNHFFIYDNESEDNLKELLQPYIDAGLVTYKFFPGEMIQTPAYNDALNEFRFFCRYMAFIDADEFIFPVSKPSIVEVVDEIFGYNRSIAGLAINWQYYGSNGLKTADFSKGVLERFTRRAPKKWAYMAKSFSDKYPAGHAICKVILNPRKVKGMLGPHNALFYEKCFMINEMGRVLYIGNNFPVTVDKIAVNHYRAKTPEEYLIKIRRGNTDMGDQNFYNWDKWKNWDRNDEFDDSILKYRDSRIDEFNIRDGNILKTLASCNQINHAVILDALLKNLSPTFAQNVSPEFFKNKLETFLTCRAVVHYLTKFNFLDKTRGSVLEEAALNAIYKAVPADTQLYGLRLLISELPNILPLNYPAVKNILKACIDALKRLSNIYRRKRWFDKFADNENFLRLLKIFLNA